MPSAMPHLSKEQIEHIAVRAIELGADDLVDLCDSALRAGDGIEEIADIVANDEALAEWVERGINLGYRTRIA